VRAAMAGTIWAQSPKGISLIKIVHRSNDFVATLLDVVNCYDTRFIMALTAGAKGASSRFCKRFNPLRTVSRRSRDRLSEM
jgi:hypothetical protein